MLFPLNQAEIAEDWATVIEVGESILKLDIKHQHTRSKTAAAYRLRGASYYNKGEYDLAIADLDRSIQLNPQKANSYWQRGRSHHKKGNWDRAIADCDRAIRYDQNKADYYHQRGCAYHNKGNYDQAIADIKHAIQIGSEKAEYYYTLGLSHSAKGNNFVLQAKSNSPIFQNQKSYDQVYVMYSQAIDYFNRAITLNPDKVANYYWERGLCLLGTGSYESAINDFNRANQIQPNQTNYNYNYLLGISYKANRNYGMAIVYFTMLITFAGINNSDNSDYYYHRGECYYNQSEYSNALNDANSALKLAKNLEYYDLLAKSQAALSRRR